MKSMVAMSVGGMAAGMAATTAGTTKTSTSSKTAAPAAALPAAAAANKTAGKVAPPADSTSMASGSTQVVKDAVPASVPSPPANVQVSKTAKESTQNKASSKGNCFSLL